MYLYFKKGVISYEWKKTGEIIEKYREDTGGITLGNYLNIFFDICKEYQGNRGDLFKTLLHEDSEYKKRILNIFYIMERTLDHGVYKILRKIRKEFDEDYCEAIFSFLKEERLKKVDDGCSDHFFFYLKIGKKYQNNKA